MAVRLGGAGRLGRARRCSAAARRYAAALQRARNTARGRARLDASGRGRLLPVGEAGVRSVLGLLERLALMDLFAARHGDLSGAPDPVSRLLPAGARLARALDRGAGDDLGSDLAEIGRASCRERG